MGVHRKKVSRVLASFHERLLRRGQEGFASGILGFANLLG
jgi:hypothetical protein